MNHATEPDGRAGVYRGDEAALVPPVLPAGWGAVEVRFGFDRGTGAVGDHMARMAAMATNIWIPPPVPAIDGQECQASWSWWWYPLPAGPHEVEVREPGQVVTRIEVIDGQVSRLRYDAQIVVGEGTGSGRVVQVPIAVGRSEPRMHRLEWHGVGRLEPL